MRYKLTFIFVACAMLSVAQVTKIDPARLLDPGSNSTFLTTDGSGNVVWGNAASLLTSGSGISISGNSIGVNTNGISNSLFRQSAGLSVVGVTGNSTANVADITAGSDHQVLRRSGTSLGFGAINLAQSAAVTGVLPATNGGNVATSFAITTRTLPTTVGATVEIGALSHNSSSRASFAQFDIQILSATGRTGSKRYLIPLTFNTASGKWYRVPPVASLGPYGSADFELEMKTNSSGSPSGGIDTFRIVNTANTLSGTVYTTLQVFNPAASTLSFTETSNTSTSTVTTTAADVMPYMSLSSQGRRLGVNVIAPAYTLDVESPSAHTTPILRLGNSTTSLVQFVTNAAPEGVITANVGSWAFGSNGAAYIKELNSTAGGWYRIVTESFISRNYSFSRTMPTTVNNTVKLGQINWSQQGSGGYVEIVIQSYGVDNAMSRKYIISRSFNQTSGSWQIVPSIVSMGQYLTTMDFQLEIKSVNHVDSLRVRRLVGTSASTAMVYLQLKTFSTATQFVEESTTDNPTAVTTWYNVGTLHQSGSAFSLGGQVISGYRLANYGAFTTSDGLVRARGAGAQSASGSATLNLSNSTASTGADWLLTSTNAGHFRIYLNSLLTTQIRGSNLEFRHFATGIFGPSNSTIEGVGLTYTDSLANDAITAAENKIANGAADAVLYAKTASSGGDAKLKLHAGSVLWTLGNDISDGRLKLSQNDDPGTSPVVSIGANDWQFNKQFFAAQFALTDGATIAIDWNNGNAQRVTLGGNRTITFANPKAGATYILHIKQDGGGNRTLTWPTIKWAGGSAPTLTTTGGKTDVVTITYDGTDYFGSSSLNY